MNIAGAIGYLLHRNSPINTDTVAGALADVADEPVGPGLLPGLEPATEELLASLRPISFEELRTTGRVGLFTLDREVLDRALANSPDRPPDPDDQAWAKAVEVGSETLVYPQDRRPDVRLVVWAPAAAGPDEVRLSPLDLGVDLRAGRREPPAVEPEACSIVFRGLGANLRKACAPGTCGHPCDEEWKVRGEKATLFGCSCRRP